MKKYLVSFLLFFFLFSLQAAHANGSGRIFVKTVPEGARVRILNIVPKYTPGISLPPGRYEIEVSAPGHERVVRWYDLQVEEEKHITVVLEKGVAPQHSPSKYGKYYGMIRSNNVMQVQEGAKTLYRHYRADPEVINTAADVLAARYNEHPRDNYFVDGMAYLCNILGVSGQRRFIPLLSKIANDAASRKIRSYAKKNLARL